MSTGTRRLATIAPQQARRLEEAGQVELRRVAATVAGLAVARTGLSDSRIDEGIRVLRGQRVASVGLRALIEAVVERLDDEQWDLQDEVGHGPVTRETQLQAFSRARAANSLWFALSDDPMEAAGEAAYEAIVATDDLAAVVDAIESSLA